MSKQKLSVDFTGVTVSAERLPEGKHVVTIDDVKFKEAQTKTKMLEVKFKDSDGRVAYTNITLLEQTLWKLKKFLEAVYQRQFDSKIDMPIADLKGKRVGVEIVEETYVNKKNETKTRAAVDDFFPIPGSKDETVTEDLEDDDDGEEEEEEEVKPAPKKKKKKKVEPEPEEDEEEEEEEEEEPAPKKKKKKAEQPEREKFPWEE